MKAPLAQEAASPSRAAANQPAAKGITAPAVPLSMETPQEDTLPVEMAATGGELALSIALDMNDDGEDEPHTLFIDMEDSQLWLHSDKQTLESFLDRKYRKHGSKLTPELTALIVKITAAAQLVYTGTYGATVPTLRTSKKTGKVKTSKRVQPSKEQRDEALKQLRLLGGYLKQLNVASVTIMKKQRPPSHPLVHETHSIGSDIFCKKIVMQPLSLLPRDDGKVGSPPSQPSGLFDRLRKKIKYIRGHMLNEHLHGPGTNDNLVPISVAFNNLMRTKIEDATKEAVNSNNKVVRFEAEALNWGNFPGYLNLPDEKKLPDSFRFRVTQMKLKRGKDGSLIDDWEATGGDIVPQTILTHTPPSAADVVPGTIAPGVRTFAPGYYTSAAGNLEVAPNSNYHLSGHYLVNSRSFEYFLPAFGLGVAPLASDDLSLDVTTEFALPAGYELVPVPTGKVEFIFGDQIHEDVINQKIAFLIVDKSSRTMNLAAYEAEKKKVREAQQQREKLAQEEKERKEKLQQDKEQQRIAATQDSSRQRSEVLQRELEARFRSEGEKYLHNFNPEFQNTFKAELDKMLNTAKATWQVAPILNQGKLESELNTMTGKLAPLVNRLVGEQRSKQLLKKRLIEQLFQELTNRVNNVCLPALQHDWQKRAFLKEKEDIFKLYKDFWEKPDVLVNNDSYPALLHSAVRKLDEARNRALARPAPPQTISPYKRKLEPDREKSRHDEEEEEEPTRDVQRERDLKKARTQPDPFMPDPTPSAGTSHQQPDIPPFQPQVPFSSGPSVFPPGNDGSSGYTPWRKY